MSVIGPSRKAFQGARAHTAMARYARSSVSPSYEGIQSSAGRYARQSQARRRDTASGKRLAGYAAVGVGVYGYQHRKEIKAKGAQLHAGIHNAFHSTRSHLGA